MASDLKVQSLDQSKAGLAFKLPKSGKGRQVALPPLAVQALRRHKASQAEERLMFGPDYHDNGLVCAQPDGRPLLPDSLSHAFTKLVKKAGVKSARLHDIRHTHATLLLRQGVHPKVVSERLGHATIGITLDTYSHVMPDLQQEAARKVDLVLRAAIQGS